MPEQPGEPAVNPRDPYTVHDDADTADDTAAPAVEPGPDPVRTRRGPDPLALVAGLAAVLVAVLALTDTLAATVTAVDGRWLLAVAAIVVGLIVLAVASRPRARRDRQRRHVTDTGRP